MVPVRQGPAVGHRRVTAVGFDVLLHCFGYIHLSSINLHLSQQTTSSDCPPCFICFRTFIAESRAGPSSLTVLLRKCLLAGVNGLTGLFGNIFRQPRIVLVVNNDP